MKRVWLMATARWATRLTFVLVGIGAARVAFVAWPRKPNVVVTPAVMPGTNEPPPQPFDLLGLEGMRKKLAPAVPAELLQPTAIASGSAAPRPKRTQVYLVVNVTPDRSEVLIDGVLRGHTPYVGEVTCPTGGALEVTVLPPKGLPKTFQRPCDRYEIRIDERDPESGRHHR